MRGIKLIFAVGAAFLSCPVAANAQGLNDVVLRVLNNNCSELGGPGTQSGPLANLCRFLGPTGSAGGGAGVTVDTRLGQTQEERRQAERLADRRDGRGGSADQAGGGFGLFTNADYQFLNKDTTRFETGFEQHTAGGTVGLDYSFRGRAVLGVAVNYAHEFGDFAGVSGGFDNNLYGVTLYGTVVPMNNLFIDGFVGYTRKEYSITRRVNYVIVEPGGILRPGPAIGLIDGATNSNEIHVGGTVGYDFVLGKFTVGPRFGVNYSDARIAGYEEHAAFPPHGTGVELVYDTQNILSLTTTTGVFASVALSTPVGVVVPQATAEYVHEFLNRQRSVGFTFAGSDTRPRLLFQTDSPDRNFFNLGVGAVLVMPNGMSIFANVRQLLGYDIRRATTVTAGLRVGF